MDFDHCVVPLLCLLLFLWLHVPLVGANPGPRLLVLCRPLLAV